MTGRTIFLFGAWGHVNGAALAFAVIDNSHGQPYPDRPLLALSIPLLIAALVSLWRERVR